MSCHVHQGIHHRITRELPTSLGRTPLRTMGQGFVPRLCPSTGASSSVTMWACVKGAKATNVSRGRLAAALPPYLHDLRKQVFLQKQAAVL